MFNCKLLIKHNIGYITFIIKQGKRSIIWCK